MTERIQALQAEILKMLEDELQNSHEVNSSLESEFLSLENDLARLWPYAEEHKEYASIRSRYKVKTESSKQEEEA